jgi:putative serine/threonine protein kinase
MRRTDSGRDDLLHEAEMLRKANDVNVGPRFAAVTKNFLLSQLIDGCLLEKWLNDNRNEDAFRRMFRDIMRMCRRLDDAGLDHGELSMAPRHILIDRRGNPFIVDFETASIQRKVSNVTSVCQYLFLGTTPVPGMAREVLGAADRDDIVSALRRYKRERSDDEFEALMKVCLRCDRQ